MHTIFRYFTFYISLRMVGTKITSRDVGFRDRDKLQRLAKGYQIILEFQLFTQISDDK